MRSFATRVIGQHILSYDCSAGLNIDLEMKITFESHCLLYGVSLLWVVVQIFCPYFIWPNFAKTRNDHVLKSWPKLLERVHSFGRRTKAISWGPRITMFISVGLNVALLVDANYVQTSFLASIGVVDDSRLTYRVLRNLPFLVVSNRKKEPT